MGNREKLLDAALGCLLDKGYAQTTARDIATTAGVSLAAIGYHFKTTEALLNEALRQAMERWGDELHRALNDEHDGGLPPQERFVAVWNRIIASVVSNRPLWTTQFEIVTQLGRLDAPQAGAGTDWSQAQEDGWTGLAELFTGVDADREPELARSVGGLYQALLTGVVVQHLVTPERAMSGRELATALQAVAGRIAHRAEV